MNIKKVIKYGTEVFQSVDMDELRKTECMCLNCKIIKDCLRAESLYDICKEHNIALMVTRCPMWVCNE